MKIDEAIKIGANLLKENKIEEAKFISKRLLAYLLKKDITYITVHSESHIDDNIKTKYENAIHEIINGKPLQYITNEQYFMGYKFYVDENVLIPQPDTEILVEEVLNLIKKHGLKSVLDLCTGSGAIAVSIAKKLQNIDVYASDISKEALEVAKINAKGEEVIFIESDLFENINQKFDIIVSNPPYIKTEVIKQLEKQVQNEPVIALDGGKDGLKFYKKIIKQAKNYLNENGFLALEIGFDQKEEVMKILKEENFKEIYCIKDFGGNDRVVIGKK